MDDLNSEFDYESEVEARKRKRKDLLTAEAEHKKKADKSFFLDEQSKEGRKRSNNLVVDVYTRHKQLINEYYLFYPGATKDVLKRDTSKDRNDYDVIRENHKFLWNPNDDDTSWEKRLAKRYYDKLFKEYCIADFSRYKENKVAMRWRVEAEVVEGKGQFQCGGRKCPVKEALTTWEVNFAYLEDGTKKNALVKLRLCPDCSYKLNYHHKKKKVEKKPKKAKKARRSREKEEEEEEEWAESKPSSSKSRPVSVKSEAEVKAEAEEAAKASEETASELWKQPQAVEEEKSREDEFDEFLEDLFL